MLRRPATLTAGLIAALSLTPGMAEARPVPTNLAPVVDLKHSAAPDALLRARLTMAARTVRPVTSYTLTSGFKDRSRHNHEGVDLAAPRGTAVYAAKRGVVTFVGWADGYGRKIMINHGSGIVTVYAHLDSFSVKQGQTVWAGKRIGRVGMSGRTTGPHLHFEVLKNGAVSDPAKWLRKLGVRL